MTTPWLDVDTFSLRTVMPSEDVDRLESRYPGFLTAQLAAEQAWIEDRLRKRYAVPFAPTVPETIRRWLSDLVTLAAYQRRGWNPAGAENQLIIDAATRARDEVKEAANAQEGLFELPLRTEDPGTTGATVGGPLATADASPYRWTTQQRDDAASEDQ